MDLWASGWIFAGLVAIVAVMREAELRRRLQLAEDSSDYYHVRAAICEMRSRIEVLEMRSRPLIHIVDESMEQLN